MAERAERKLQEQAEEEARREAAASTDAEVRAKLRAALAEAGWGLSADDLVEAERLVAWRDGKDWAWAWGHRDRAQGYIARLHGFMARAAGRVAGAEVSDEDLARVADPEARTIVLQGCRYLSGLDGDRAVEENGIGWSKTTSWTGHWLAGHEALDEREAAVGLGLLRIHRRQLDEAVQERLFGVVEKPRKPKDVKTVKPDLSEPVEALRAIPDDPDLDSTVQDRIIGPSVAPEADEVAAAPQVEAEVAQVVEDPDVVVTMPPGARGAISAIHRGMSPPGPGSSRWARPCMAHVG